MGGVIADVHWHQPPPRVGVLIPGAPDPAIASAAEVALAKVLLALPRIGARPEIRGAIRRPAPMERVVSGARARVVAATPRGRDRGADGIRPGPASEASDAPSAHGRTVFTAGAADRHARRRRGDETA